MCFEGIYEPLVFLKNPHTFHGSLVFGENQITKKCPKDKSRTDVSFIYGTDSHAMEIYNDRKLEEDGVCPREILRFDPPPKLAFCRSNAYRPITSIAEFTTRLKFTNVSFLISSSIGLDLIYFFFENLDARFVQQYCPSYGTSHFHILEPRSNAQFKRRIKYQCNSSILRA